jgi:hypothetical protein
MLQPHLRLPVETGFRCLLVCAFLLLAQLENNSTKNIKDMIKI